MLEATEMDFWRRAVGRSRFEKITNDRIGEVVQVTHMVVGEIKNRQLMWYGNVQKMSETQIPKQVINWKPSGNKT